MEPTARKTRSPSRKRRWFQFSLRTLLVVVLLASIGMSWFAVKMQQARRQREAVVAILAGGGWVTYDWQPQYSPEPEPPGLKRLYGLLDDDWFRSVIEVTFDGEVVTDDALAHLKKLTSLQSVSFRGPGVSDAQLVHLGVLVNLKKLRFSGTQITDEGLVHLRSLKGLKMLSISSTQITDQGLLCLRDLTGLEELHLGSTEPRRLLKTHITDEGLAHLRGLQALRRLGLDHLDITDAGLEHVAALEDLEELALFDVPIQGQGLRHLTRLKRLWGLGIPLKSIDEEYYVNLPGIVNLQYLTVLAPSDCAVEHLRHIKSLTSLRIWGGYGDRKKMDELRRRLPQVKVSE